MKMTDQKQGGVSYFTLIVKKRKIKHQEFVISD
jgi:hypothetical protein